MTVGKDRDERAEAVPAAKGALQNSKPSPPNAKAAVQPGGDALPHKVTEIGGPKGPEPTRYGDWERNGRCIDF